MQLYTAPRRQRRGLPRRDGAGGGKELPGASTLVRAYERPAARQRSAQQEIDYGRRGKGYVFGAFLPATGERLDRARPSAARSPTGSTSWSRSRPGSTRRERVYAILDNLSAHRAPDVLLWALAHPRWEFVFQPKYAAYLNLIEPWWKILRSLALKGRRFESWEEIVPGGRRGDRRTGMPIAIPSSGAGDAVTSPPPTGIALTPSIQHELARMDH